MTRRLSLSLQPRRGHDSAAPGSYAVCRGDTPPMRPTPLYNVIAAAHLAPALRPLPATRDGQGAPPAEGGFVLAAQPRLELRPVAARDAALAETVPALHGEVGALLVAARARSSTARARFRCAAGSATPSRSRPRCGSRARATSSRCSRRGRAERKGCVKKREARPRTGAARIALEAGVPLVPAAVSGTDKLLRLGKLRVAYGAPVDIEDLRGQEIAEAAQEATDAADGAHPRARGVALSVLLAVDGDSFAHRAYHGCPKIDPAATRSSASRTCCSRLWEAEQPGRGRSSAGTRSRCRPTATRRSTPYQSGREFDDVAPRAARRCCRELVESIGLRRRRRAPATRPTTSSPRRRATWPGECSSRPPTATPTSSSSDRVTILQPTKGVSEIARIGAAEVRERYGVDPEQVPDLIALRGDPSDKLPGARGIGPKKAADAPAAVRHARGVLADGPLRGRGGGLAPLPANRDRWTPPPPFLPSRTRHPTWAEASSFLRQLGLDALADRLASLA